MSAESRFATWRWSTPRDSIGFVFQAFNLIPPLSALENVRSR